MKFDVRQSLYISFFVSVCEAVSKTIHEKFASDFHEIVGPWTVGRICQILGLVLLKMAR